jgi:hypothetical protein
MRIRAIPAIVFLASLAVISSPVLAANLVVNGGFETGDFTGWTQSGNTDWTFENEGSHVEGAHGAMLGPLGSDGYLTQMIFGNSLSFQFRNDPLYWELDAIDLEWTGSTYTLTFWLRNQAGSINDFTVL